MLQDFLLPFLAIGAAEFFDKSQLSLLLLATRTKNHTQLLLGSMLGFILVDGLAVLVGAWITTLVPEDILSKVAGLVFLIVGIVLLKNASEKPEEKKVNRSPFLAGFLIILLVEWGDKTQLATAVFATQLQPVLVFFGVISALFLLSALAIYLGKLLRTKIEEKTIHLIAGIAFIIIGLVFLFFRS